ncbi:RNA-binding protein 41 [Varanus komodoensis]|uniref:RNA-binding protein 41 isoform X2 n=1 Tax=Varanus komodoensis TaxID=61221 RepID=UPI001CF7E307|nr:RNA-binding protein 41 isoform X2 [Varanus komodoensis]KAF7237396.1 RNA-binding protein 41 [Varanus komodoensis]
MRRVSSSLSADDLLLEDLETEGERQLKSLLHHQLDTSVSIEQCVSKRRCFAPATVYKPFGEEAAGARSLPQFQALQESSKEMAALRDLGLTDAEIHLWRSRAMPEKSSGLGAAPEATQDRIQVIREKIAERQRILALPQRFAGSKQLSRREMEIENALFQGTDRHSFLRMLYHRDETRLSTAHETGPVAQLETVYQDLLSQEMPESRHPHDHGFCPSTRGGGSSSPAAQNPAQPPALGPVMVTEPVEFVPEEEICKNRLSEEEIRRIPRFSSYSPGEPSQVLYLKNLSCHVTVRDLLSLFARFQECGGPQIRFRLLSGRMRGQAFLTFPSIATARAALELANGFLLMGKPLVIEFGRSKQPAGGAEADPALLL